MTLFDADAGQRELIEQQAFLRRLARRLVGDEHGAEDLVQDASVAALEGAPRGQRSMRSWLARVVRNRATNMARGQQRRAARELDAARPDLPETPEQVAQHLAVQRRVLAAVAGLKEPYKTAIYLRYYADLGPTAISERTGAALSTVKTRLARGLERLRCELDAEHGGDRRVWAVCLAGTFDVGRDTVIGSSIASGGALMGATVMGTKWIAIAVVVALAWRVGANLMERDPRPGGVEYAAPAAVPVLLPRLVRAEKTGARAPTPVQEPEPGLAAPSWLLKLTLNGLKEGTGEVVAIDVQYQGVSMATATFTSTAARHVEVDVSSIFEGRQRLPERLKVTLDHPRYLRSTRGVNVPFDARAPLALDVALDLVRPSGTVTGRVIAPSSVGPQNVRVDLIAMKDGRPEYWPVDSAHGDPEGRYRLRTGAADAHVVVAWVEGEAVETVSGHLPAMFRPQTRPVELVDGKSELEPIVFDRGARIGGRVEFPEGGAFDGEVEIRITPFGIGDFCANELRWLDDRFVLKGLSVPWDEQRQFHIEGLEQATYRIKAVGAAPSPRGSNIRTLHTFWNDDPFEKVSATAEDLALSVVRVRHSFLVSGGGEPIEGARFNLATRHVTPDHTGSTGSRTNEDGRVDVVAEKGRPLNIRVSHPGYEPREIELSAADLEKTGTIKIELTEDRPPAAIEIGAGESGWPMGIVYRLVLFDLRALEQTRVAIEKQRIPFVISTDRDSPRLTREPWDVPDLKLATQADGTWVIEGIPAGDYFLRIVASSANPDLPCYYLTVDYDLQLAPGEYRTLAWEPKSGADLRIHFLGSGEGVNASLLDAHGAVCRPTYWRQGPGVHEIASSAGPMIPGLNLVAPALAKGSYTLRVEAPDGRHDIPVTLEAGRVTKLEVDLDDL